MSKLMSLGFVLSLFLSANAMAQETTQETIKKNILEKVRVKLAKERTKILKQVSELIEKELAQTKKKPAKKKEPSMSEEMAKAIKKLEREERILKEKRDEVQTQIQKMKRLAQDESIREEAKENGPEDGEDAQALFDEALRAHEAADYKKIGRAHV